MRLNYRQIEKIGAYRAFWRGGEPRHSRHGQSPRSPSSNFPPFLESSPDGEARPFSLLSSALVKSEGGLPTTSDVVARKICDPVHHFERLRDNLLQEVRLFANDFACDLICEKQDALQPIGKAQQHLVAFILFLHELNSFLLPLLLIRQ